MTKTRRKFLYGLTTVSLASLAGCGQFSGSEEKTVEAPELLGIQSSYIDCQQTSDTATISQGLDEDGEKKQLLIEGRMNVQSTCVEAVLSGFSYNSGKDVGVLTITTQQNSKKECKNCNGTLQYRMRVEFGETIPSQLKIKHTGEGVVGSTDLQT